MKLPRGSRHLPVRVCLAAIAPIFLPSIASAIPAFSGAEGYGASFNSSLFSSATVYHVTTTADLLDANSKPLQGTLRGAFFNYANPSQPKEGVTNQIVVFDVGGTFQLLHGSLDIKTLNNIYIAGQTAPSPVTVYGDTSQITHSNNTTNTNVILRYMSFRRGTAVDGNTDAFGIVGGSNAGTGSSGSNIVVDHISTSWATDEDLSVANVNTNVSIQYSIIADSLRTTHAYGSLIRPRSNSNVTYSHNLYANNLSRQPRPGTYNGNTLNFDFENNVVYNWKDRAGYSGGSSEPEIEHVNMNYAGNYLVAGPSTTPGTPASTAFTMDSGGDNPPDLHIYQTGNAIDSDRAANPGGVPNGSDTGWGMFRFSNGVSTSAFPDLNKWSAPIGSPTNTGAPANTVAAPAFALQSAADAFTQVTSYAGNYWWARDGIDARIVGNVLNVTNPVNGVAANEPDAAEVAAVLNAPTVSRAAGFDTDRDGMPDAWETAMGLNPASAADGKLDFDTDGYTNVEEYLNELGAFPAPLPIQFTGATNARYAQITNWNIPFQPSRFDTVLINAGTANVDAIGQDAGSITIGTIANQSPTLAVNAGRLNVRQNLNVGAATGGTSTLRLTGGKLIVSGVIGGGVGTDNVFAFTGGTLVTAGVDATTLRATTGGAAGTFRQNGAASVLAAGDVGIAGRTLVVGNYALDAGTVAIDLGGTAAAASYQSATPAYDNIVASGAITLNGGTIALARLAGYDPAMLVNHTVLEGTSLSGHFTQVTGLQVSETKSLAVTYDATGVHVTATYAGDANVDGKVNFNDLVALAQSYNESGKTWSQGDFNGDGSVGFLDLVVLAQRYGDGTGGAIVAASFAADWALAQEVALAPEPTTLSLIALAPTLFARRRR